MSLSVKVRHVAAGTTFASPPLAGHVRDCGARDGVLLHLHRGLQRGRAEPHDLQVLLAQRSSRVDERRVPGRNVGAVPRLRHRLLETAHPLPPARGLRRVRRSLERQVNHTRLTSCSMHRSYHGYEW